MTKSAFDPPGRRVEGNLDEFENCNFGFTAANSRHQEPVAIESHG